MSSLTVSKRLVEAEEQVQREQRERFESVRKAKREAAGATDFVTAKRLKEEEVEMEDALLRMAGALSREAHAQPGSARRAGGT